jgi:hypothetical protein
MEVFNITPRPLYSRTEPCCPLIRRLRGPPSLSGRFFLKKKKKKKRKKKVLALPATEHAVRCSAACTYTHSREYVQCIDTEGSYVTPAQFMLL